MNDETAMTSIRDSDPPAILFVIRHCRFTRHSGFVIRHSFGEWPAFSEAPAYDVRSKEQWMSESSSPASAARA
jgi:hypothetical protein